MIINDLSFAELARIIQPVIQIQPMSRVCSEIGEVLGIVGATRKKIQDIQKQDNFRLSYKGFEVFFYSLRWLRGRGPCMSLQFKRPATEWQKLLADWFDESHKH